MNAPFQQRVVNTAVARLKQQYQPKNMIEGLAQSYEQSPMAFLFLMVLVPGIAYISALGISGAFGVPPALARGFGLLGVIVQCALYAESRSPLGPRNWLRFFFATVMLWNAVSLASGLVAARPDAMGRALIERQLQQTLKETENRAGALTRKSAVLTDLAKFSTQMAAQEGAWGSDWKPTCPNSTIDGPGRLTTWRDETGKSAAAHARTLETAAQQARDSANAARKAVSGYALARHDEAMMLIQAAISGINSAKATANFSGIDAFVTQLRRDTAANGLCPDITTQNKVNAVQAVSLAALNTDASFVPPERPSEALAIRDLLNQVSLWIGQRFGWYLDQTVDLSLYAVPLIVSPIIDLLLMTMLGMVLLPHWSTNKDALFVARIGGRPDEGHLLDAATTAAKDDAEWMALIGNIEVTGGRLFRGYRLFVEHNDWPRLRPMLQLQEEGKVRYGGLVDGKHVFCLTQRFLRDRFDGHILAAIIAKRAGPTSFNPMA